MLRPVFYTLSPALLQNLVGRDVRGRPKSLSVKNRQCVIESGNQRPEFWRIGFERRGDTALPQRPRTHRSDRCDDQAIQLARKLRGSTLSLRDGVQIINLH